MSLSTTLVYTLWCGMCWPVDPSISTLYSTLHFLPQHLILMTRAPSKSLELRNHHQRRQSSTHLVTTIRSMAEHEIPQKTRLNDNSVREDSTHDSPKPNPTRWRGSFVQTTRSTGQQTGISMASKAFGSDVTWFEVVRCLLNAMVWDPWNATPVTRGRPLKVRSDREPILMGPIQRVQVNKRTTSGTTTTQSVAERTRVRLPEAEAEGARPMQRTKTSSVPVPTTAGTTSQTATTSPARALVERVGDEAGEDSQHAQMRRIAALMAECEDSSTSDDIAEARRVHLEKLTKVKDAVIKVVPRTDANTKPLTRRWVDTARRCSEERQVDDAWQALNGNEDFFSATPAMMHLKMMLVDAALKGHVAAIGDCSGAFYQSLLNPDGTESKVWIEPPPEAEWVGARLHLGSRVSIPRSRDTYSANALTNSMQMEQSRHDGCLFYRFEPHRERVEEKPGRHIDDFLVTRPEPNVERFLTQARDKLNMQDSVRLY